MPDQGVGVLASFVGSTLVTAGLFVQKRAMTAHDVATSTTERDSARESASPSRPYYMQFGWIMGTALWLSGQVLCGFGQGVAPQSVTAVMGSWNIILTLIISAVFLGERITNRAKLAALCLAGGCSWIVVAQPSHSHTETSDSLWRGCRSFSFILAVIICSGFLICMRVVSGKRARGTPTATLSAVEFVCVAAVFGCFAAISSKSMFSLIVASFSKATFAVANLAFVVSVVGVVAFGCCQIHFINMAFRKGRAAVVIPCYMGLSMTGQMVIGGVLFFKEFENLGGYDIVIFWLGLIPLLAGIFLMTNHDSPVDTKPTEAPFSNISMNVEPAALIELGLPSNDGSKHCNIV
eukprot:TRINITY_DN2385_c0_g1_i1.p1 TRINITY_DN2385_c0_g1~~TRINITY_DN2385_c0_g1_i1.p1  ORF type:complete len:350 (+),score=31.81 TRINITY_DN2385_c0_g1_i1:163-1212(+)